jgi:hypothetical protein
MSNFSTKPECSSVEFKKNGRVFRSVLLEIEFKSLLVDFS